MISRRSRFLAMQHQVEIGQDKHVREELEHVADRVVEFVIDREDEMQTTEEEEDKSKHDKERLRLPCLNVVSHEMPKDDSEEDSGDEEERVERVRTHEYCDECEREHNP